MNANEIRPGDIVNDCRVSRTTLKRNGYIIAVHFESGYVVSFTADDDVDVSRPSLDGVAARSAATSTPGK